MTGQKQLSTLRRVVDRSGTNGLEANGHGLSDQWREGPVETIFPAQGPFLDAEVTALRRERDQLRAALASRNEAWREVLRELSRLQEEVLELRGETEARGIEPLTIDDWESMRPFNRSVSQ